MTARVYKKQESHTMMSTFNGGVEDYVKRSLVSQSKALHTLIFFFKKLENFLCGLMVYHGILVA